MKRARRPTDDLDTELSVPPEIRDSLGRGA